MANILGKLGTVVPFLVFFSLNSSFLISERFSWAFSSGAGWTPSITTTGGCCLCLRLYKGHLLLQMHVTVVTTMIAMINKLMPAAPPIIPPINLNLPIVLETRDSPVPASGVTGSQCSEGSSLLSPQLLILLQTNISEIHLPLL